MSQMFHLYKTQIDFTHSIKQVKALVDKSCLAPHAHTAASVTISIKRPKNQWVDFKTNKEKIEQALQQFRGDIGIMDTETIVSQMQAQIAKALALPKANIAISFYETAKYGIEIR